MLKTFERRCTNQSLLSSDKNLSHFSPPSLSLLRALGSDQEEWTVFKESRFVARPKMGFKDGRRSFDRFSRVKRGEEAHKCGSGA